jgi:transposase
LRNIFLDTVDFTSDSLYRPQNKLQQNFAEIFSNLSASSEFVELIANKFTKKEEKKVITVPENELLKHLLNQYFRKIKWTTNGLARRIIALRNKIDKVSLQKHADKRQKLIQHLEKDLISIETKLFSFIEPFQFATKQEFRRKRDLQLDGLKSQFQIKLDSFKIEDLYQLIKKEFDNEIASIYEPNNNYILKRLFKPNFPSIRILDVNLDSLTQYIKTRFRYKIRENLKYFFTTDNITNLFIDKFRYIKQNLYDMVTIPTVRKFSLSLIMPEIFRENYSKYDEGLDILAFKLGFISRQFVPFKIIDKNNRLRKQLDNGFSPANPTITFKNRKLLLNLPFEIKKGEFNPSQEQDSNNPNIEMGIDLGLKHFAVVCVWDKKQNLELARYFIGTRQLFDKKLVERDDVLKWQYQDRFKTSSYNNQSNIKLKLINLRKQIKQLQRKKNNYEQRLLEKGITNFRNKLKWNKIRRELSLCWDKINRLNKQIVDFLNSYVLKIARFWNVSTIKMENLRWSTQSKKRDAGKFMAFWQTHWFYSQVQEAVKFQCDLNSIGFQRVPAGYTSQRCSRCGELGSRASKQFSCSHCGTKLDSDLNASRNVVKFQNNNMCYINTI